MRQLTINDIFDYVLHIVIELNEIYKLLMLLIALVVNI